VSSVVVSWQRLLTVEILQLPRSRHSRLAIVSQLNSQLRIRVNLRLAVYRQSVRLGDKPLETHDQYCFFS
jgi:hypothetical protein